MLPFYCILSILPKEKRYMHGSFTCIHVLHLTAKIKSSSLFLSKKHYTTKPGLIKKTWGKKGLTMNEQFRMFCQLFLRVRKRAKIRNRCNCAPHLTQDTNGKVTTSQLDITNKSQEVSPFPAGDHKVSINRIARTHNKSKTEIT